MACPKTGFFLSSFDGQRKYHFSAKIESVVFFVNVDERRYNRLCGNLKYWFVELKFGGQRWNQLTGKPGADLAGFLSEFP